MLLQDPVDPVGRKQQVGERIVVVQSVYEKRDVFRQIDAVIVFPLKKLGLLIGQVRRQHAVDQTLLVSLVKFRQAVREKAEGRGDEDAGGAPPL